MTVDLALSRSSNGGQPTQSSIGMNTKVDLISLGVEESVLKLEPGDPIRIDAGKFERLSKAFLAELDARLVH